MSAIAGGRSTFLRSARTANSRVDDLLPAFSPSAGIFLLAESWMM